jgi:hypothetical protein
MRVLQYNMSKIVIQKKTFVDSGIFVAQQNVSRREN